MYIWQYRELTDTIIAEKKNIGFFNMIRYTGVQFISFTSNSVIVSESLVKLWIFFQLI